MVIVMNWVQIVLTAVHFGSFLQFKNRASLSGILLQKYLIIVISYIQKYHVDIAAMLAKFRTN